MDYHELIKDLKEQSTWRLLGIGIITYGVYFAYYIKRQTDKINSHLDKESAISNGFINSIMVMSYISAALLIPYMIVDFGHPIEKVSNLSDRIWGIMLIVWGFKARNRVNDISNFNSESSHWFHGLWTFLFTPLYFNYKVNQLNDEHTEQADPSTQDTAANGH